MSWNSVIFDSKLTCWIIKMLVAEAAENLLIYYVEQIKQFVLDRIPNNG